MYINPKVTLYLFFDSKISKTRNELETKFYFVAHKKLQDVSPEDVEYLLSLCHRLEVLHEIYSELYDLFS
mgnify:FL=1